MDRVSLSPSAAAGLITRRLDESLELVRAMREPGNVQTVADIARMLVDCLSAGGQLLFCGNGGSAADAMHLATEFVGRFRLERPALPALSLSDNVSAVTAIGNDYDYARSFARQVEAFGREGDVLLALTTSGTSANVLAAVETARERGLGTVGLTGRSGGRLAEGVDVCLRIPAEETARIQEGYMLAAHVVCELVESALFAES